MVLDQAIESAVLLLGFAAERLIDDAAVYNATKHGLGVNSDHSRISLGTAPDDNNPTGVTSGLEEEVRLELSRAGPWISNLETTRCDARERDVWAYTRTALPLDQTLVLTAYMTNLLGVLWSLGRYRFSGHDLSQLVFPDPELVRSIIRSESKGIRKVRRELRYTDGLPEAITLTIGLCGRVPEED